MELAPDGERALEIMRQDGAADAANAADAIGAIVLDVMLPGKNGFQVAAELRKRGQFVPILMLTARGRPEDVLNGFASGADDYLAKPFELAILLARLRGLLRRREWTQQNGPQHKKTQRPAVREPFTFAGKTLDFGALQLRVGKHSYRLTAMEAELLAYFVEKHGQAVSRKNILEDVWGLHEDTDTRAIDNFIARLRKYIEKKPASPRHLLTVRGVGYKFVAEPK